MKEKDDEEREVMMMRRVARWGRCKCQDAGH
jgi:hypothetical protein